MPIFVLYQLQMGKAPLSDKRSLGPSICPAFRGPIPRARGTWATVGVRLVRASLSFFRSQRHHPKRDNIVP